MKVNVLKKREIFVVIEYSVNVYWVIVDVMCLLRSYFDCLLWYGIFYVLIELEFCLGVD